MRHPARHGRDAGRIDTKMTPMIDVIFQLQIFFLCTAGFVKPESILPTELPETEPAVVKPIEAPTDFELVQIRMRGRDAGLRIQLNQREVSDVSELGSQLRKLADVSKDLLVVLDIGPEVALGNVVAAYDQCLASGLTRINFAAGKQR